MTFRLAVVDVALETTTFNRNGNRYCLILRKQIHFFMLASKLP